MKKEKLNIKKLKIAKLESMKSIRGGSDQLGSMVICIGDPGISRGDGKPCFTLG